MPDRCRVGIIGVQAIGGNSWGARAHVPALRWLSDDFELKGVANTSEASAVAAAEAYGIPKPFKDMQALVHAPDIDLVTVAVRVPYHMAIVEAALQAGKHVFCEWPLGNGLAEGREMAALARRSGRLAIVGTQARVAPAILYVKQLIADGYVGNILSSTIVGRGRSWGATLESSRSRSYLLDPGNGATMVTIPMGHMLSAMQEVLGDIADVSAVIANMRPTIHAGDIDKVLPMSSPDQAVLNGHLESGAIFSLHYRGGERAGPPGLVWDICGSDGDLRITGINGHAQMVRLTVEGARGEGTAMAELPLPAQYTQGWPEEIEPGNVARLYARLAHDLRHGTRTAPDFDDAVGLHSLIDAIERASASGNRLRPGVRSRPLDAFATTA